MKHQDMLQSQLAVPLALKLVCSHPTMCHARQLSRLGCCSLHHCGMVLQRLGSLRSGCSGQGHAKLGIPTLQLIQVRPTCEDLLDVHSALGLTQGAELGQI